MVAFVVESTRGSIPVGTIINIAVTVILLSLYKFRRYYSGMYSRTVIRYSYHVYSLHRINQLYSDDTMVVVHDRLFIARFLIYKSFAES